MATGPARLRAAAVAVAGVLALGGAIGARATGTAAAHARENGAHRAAVATTRAFDLAVDNLRGAVSALAIVAPDVANHAAAPSASASRTVRPGGVSAVVVTPVSGTPVVAAGTLPAGVTLGALRGSLASAFELARDTSDPHADVVGRDLAIAVPVYRGTVVSTEQRRASLTAWVVAVVDIDAFLARIGSPRDTVVLHVGGDAVTSEHATNTAAAESTVDLAGQPLHAVVSPHVEGGAGAMAATLVLLACAGIAGVLLVWRRAHRLLATSVSANEALERETRTVAEIGPLLQQSLDLAEVLPAVAVRLSDEFTLESFSVELIGEHGTLVDVFSIGRRASGTPEVVIGPDGARAGVEFALPLLRAARTIGRLRLTPRELLTLPQVDALRGAADLIAVATYNVELYEREQATVRRLQELDRLKDAFLGTISHELRTPITAIGGFARMLNERWDDLTEEQRRDFLRRVGRNSASLGLLVDDLLDFARLERQALSTNVTPIPLDEIVAGFAAQVVPALGDHEIITDLAPGVMALADPRAIERVLANLLTNAAKFSPPSSPVEVALRTGDRSAVLTVSDRGPGIAEEDRLRVFTRFYRGESEVARSTRGAGIGLAVVHELVTQMGGDIQVRPREPNGTTMVVRLPLATPAAPLDIDPPAPRSPEEDRIPARSRP